MAHLGIEFLKIRSNDFILKNHATFISPGLSVIGVPMAVGSILLMCV